MKRPSMSVNEVQSAPVAMCPDVCAAPPRDPVRDEGNDLRREAQRAVQRLLAHEAVHQQWRVVSTAKALEALGGC